MPIAVLNNVVYYFVHVPKTGGTAVKSLLSENGRVAIAPPNKPNWSKCALDHAHEEIAATIIPKRFYDHGFIILRDPVSRMKSEARMQAMPAVRGPNPVNLLTLAICKITGKTPYSFNFGGFRLNATIDLWLWFRLHLARLFPYMSNNHFRPQAEFWREDLIPFFYEDGLGKVRDWLLHTSGKDGLPEIGIVMPRGSNAAVQEVVFSEKSTSLIHKIYQQDFELIKRLSNS